MSVQAPQSNPKSVLRNATPANNSKYIVIEGPIGVGKSSLAKRLATSYASSLMLEQSIDNPFLERFYKSPKQWALQTQLFFLFQRLEQLENVEQKGLAQNHLIADFMLEKDPIFAKVTLDDDEYQLYYQVYKNLQIEKPKPDLLIYLQAPVEVLQDRIHRRRVRYEMGMDLAYLQQLSDAYTDYFHHYDKTPLLIVNAAEMNPVDNDEHYTALLNHINRIDAGKHFFNPLVEI